MQPVERSLVSDNPVFALQRAALAVDTAKLITIRTIKDAVYAVFRDPTILVDFPSSGTKSESLARVPYTEIVVVDDDKPTVNVVAGTVARLGFRCVGFGGHHATINALAYLTNMDKNPPTNSSTLIISDYDMEQFNGLTLLEAIRALPTFAHTDAAILTHYRFGSMTGRFRDEMIKDVMNRLHVAAWYKDGFITRPDAMIASIRHWNIQGAKGSAMPAPFLSRDDSRGLAAY